MTLRPSVLIDMQMGDNQPEGEIHPNRADLVVKEEDDGRRDRSDRKDIKKEGDDKRERERDRELPPGRHQSMGVVGACRRDSSARVDTDVGRSYLRAQLAASVRLQALPRVLLCLRVRRQVAATVRRQGGSSWSTVLGSLRYGIVLVS